SLQQIQIVCVDPIPPPENQHDQAQSYGHLRRRYGDDEEGEDVAVHVAELPGEGDKDDVGGVPHDLDAHQDDQRAAPGEDAGDADGEEDRADCDVRRYSCRFQTIRLLFAATCGASLSIGSSRLDEPAPSYEPFFGRPTRTTTPITAASR